MSSTPPLSHQLLVREVGHDGLGCQQKNVHMFQRLSICTANCAAFWVKPTSPLVDSGVTVLLSIKPSPAFEIGSGPKVVRIHRVQLHVLVAFVVHD